MGQVKKTIDGRGIATTFDYDGQGRLMEQIEAAGTNVAARTERKYDAVGNLIRVIHPRTSRKETPYGPLSLGTHPRIAIYSGQSRSQPTRRTRQRPPRTTL